MLYFPPMWIFWLSANGKEVKATSSVGGSNVFPLSDPNLSPDFLDLYLLLGSLLSFQAARNTEFLGWHIYEQQRIH